jgi:uncharacterized protein with von Willebrand factor type A (vWA) domain
MPDSLRTVSRFAAQLRRAGLAIGSSAVIDYVHAAQLLPPQDLYWAGRTTLVTSPEQLVIYDRVFGTFFGSQSHQTLSAPTDLVMSSIDENADSTTDHGKETPREDDTAGVSASGIELLQTRDFAACTAEELEALRELIRRLAAVAPQRRRRRWHTARNGRIDLRSTTRRIIRTAGVAELPAHRRRTSGPRRLIFLVDISRSMSSYSRALLIFAQTWLHTNRAVEVFCFGTQLTRLTAALRAQNPDLALQTASRAVGDWDGGTRIGASVGAFINQYGHRGMARGAVVVLCSDGLECGDPEVLRRQMARLSRLAYRVIWLNPLKGGHDYQPAARGMRAALDFIDVFLSGHNLASLQELSTLIPRLRNAVRDRGRESWFFDAATPPRPPLTSPQTERSSS